MTNRVAHLVCVSTENNNKYYNMVDNGDGTMTVTYGRVGGHETSRTYPVRKWDSILRAKTRPKSNKAHYREIASMANVATVEHDPVISTDFSDDPAVGRLLRRLQSYTSRSMKATYRVSAEDVTQANIDEAQEILNEISRLVDDESITIDMANNLLLDLYHVIPRQMAHVSDHLLYSTGDITRHGRVMRTVQTEQDNIDMMSQQVRAVERDDSQKDSILESMGISIISASRKEVELIRKLAGGNASRVRTVFKVVNSLTQRKCDAWMKTKKPERAAIQELWHGSRNQNWLSILDTGLLIQPTGVITTGSAFGNGIYFADRLQKSLGYTSVSGSYWADGNDDRGFCAVFNVHIGEPLTLWTGDWNLSGTELSRRGDYDSVFGKAGQRLSNNEFIVYNPRQCTIAFLAEIQ